MGKESKKRGDGHLIYDRGGKNRQWKKYTMVSSIRGAGKTGQLHVKEWN